MYYSKLRSLLALSAALSTAASLPQPIPQDPQPQVVPLEPQSTIYQLDNSTGVPTGLKGNATVVDDNPEGAAFRMVFPKMQFTNLPSGRVRGVVLAQTDPSGTGVRYSIKMTNLPEQGGPFIYHIHQSPVPGDGNCTATAAHLDPFQRGEVPPCNPNLPMTCQTGDLAGKHGAITTNPGDNTFSTVYTDDYLATGDDRSFIGNLSVVLHFANLTRITCGNFMSVYPGQMMTTSLDDMLDAADSIPDSVLIAGTVPPQQ